MARRMYSGRSTIKTQPIKKGKIKRKERLKELRVHWVSLDENKNYTTDQIQILFKFSQQYDADPCSQLRLVSPQKCNC